jgi:hypothetical protein
MAWWDANKQQEWDQVFIEECVCHAKAATNGNGTKGASSFLGDSLRNG